MQLRTGGRGVGAGGERLGRDLQVAQPDCARTLREGRRHRGGVVAERRVERQALRKRRASARVVWGSRHALAGPWPTPASRTAVWAMTWCSPRRRADRVAAEQRSEGERVAVGLGVAQAAGQQAACLAGREADDGAGHRGEGRLHGMAEAVRGARRQRAIGLRGRERRVVDDQRGPHHRRTGGHPGRLPVQSRHLCGGECGRKRGNLARGVGRRERLGDVDDPTAAQGHQL